jgi:hypothetical protein
MIFLNIVSIGLFRNPNRPARTNHLDLGDSWYVPQYPYHLVVVLIFAAI